jgi:hypothetical protein
MEPHEINIVDPASDADSAHFNMCTGSPLLNFVTEHRYRLPQAIELRTSIFIAPTGVAMVERIDYAMQPAYYVNRNWIVRPSDGTPYTLAVGIAVSAFYAVDKTLKSKSALLQCLLRHYGEEPIIARVPFDENLFRNYGFRTSIPDNTSVVFPRCAKTGSSMGVMCRAGDASLA